MSLKFSIITACLNRANLIVHAIESVLAQNYPNVEHIIVDGASSDGTLEVLDRYPHLTVISEPDGGIFHAWNKGLARATGDVIGVLNSDDLYGERVFDAVAELFELEPDVEVVTGKALQFTENWDGSWTVVHEYNEPPGPTLDLDRLLFWGPIINARFLRASVYRRLGHYDLRYKLSDGDFAIRLAASRPRCVYIDRYVCYYRSHSGSFSMNLEGTNRLMHFFDKLSYAEHHLTSNDLSGRDERIVRWRHSDLATRGLIDCLLGGDHREALGFLKRGWRWNVGFPFAVFKELFRILMYQLGKPFRSGPRTIATPPVAKAMTALPGRVQLEQSKTFSLRPLRCRDKDADG